MYHYLFLAVVPLLKVFLWYLNTLPYLFLVHSLPLHYIWSVLLFLFRNIASMMTLSTHTHTHTHADTHTHRHPCTNTHTKQIALVFITNEIKGTLLSRQIYGYTHPCTDTHIHVYTYTPIHIDWRIWTSSYYHCLRPQIAAFHIYQLHHIKHHSLSPSPCFLVHCSLSFILIFSYCHSRGTSREI